MLNIIFEFLLWIFISLLVTFTMENFLDKGTCKNCKKQLKGD